MRSEKKFTVENYQTLLVPMSMKELEYSVAEAEIDFKKGKFISQEELLIPEETQKRKTPRKIEPTQSPSARASPAHKRFFYSR